MPAPTIRGVRLGFLQEGQSSPVRWVPHDIHCVVCTARYGLRDAPYIMTYAKSRSTLSTKRSMAKGFLM